VPEGRSVSVLYPKSFTANVSIVLAKINGGCAYANVSSVLAEGFGVVILRNSAVNCSMPFGREEWRTFQTGRSHSPSTFRCEEQEARPPAPTATQVHRPPSSITTGATSTQKKLPSCTKWNRSPSTSCSLFRCHDTCNRALRLLSVLSHRD
jgi:hypothetical protein